MGNLTRKKRWGDGRTFVVPDSVIVGDRASTEYRRSAPLFYRIILRASQSDRSRLENKADTTEVCSDQRDGCALKGVDYDHASNMQIALSK